MSKDPNEGLLSDVLRQGGVANDPPRQSEQSVLVSADEDQASPVVTDRHTRK
jgi:hypothetical protein